MFVGSFIVRPCSNVRLNAEPVVVGAGKLFSDLGQADLLGALKQLRRHCCALDREGTQGLLGTLWGINPALSFSQSYCPFYTVRKKKIELEF